MRLRRRDRRDRRRGALGAQLILASYFGTTSTRTGEGSISARLDAGAHLGAGLAAYAVDVATGLASGLAVLDRDLWVVTTDMDVRLTAPLEGPLRVDAEVLRAGATTVVAAHTLVDESTGRVVGGGTATCRPFPISFEGVGLAMDVGEVRQHGEIGPLPGSSVADALGFVVADDGTVSVALHDGLKNPWGILHGGVLACLVDTAAAAAGGGTVTDVLLRFLNPGRVGPVVATPRVLVASDGRALVEVRIHDTGADDRLVAVATTTVTAG